MGERASRAFPVVVRFHAPGELIDGFHELVQPFAEGMEQVLVSKGLGFEKGFRMIGGFVILPDASRIREDT
jgi:hypothetical protein